MNRPQQMSKSIDEILIKFRYATNKKEEAAAKQAIYSLLASEAVDYEKWVGGNQATGHAIKVKALPLAVLREVLGVRDGS